ncbi:MAG: hypothetical protein Q9227_001151 [Pyrenula ochraceoflavens]
MESLALELAVQATSSTLKAILQLEDIAVSNARSGRIEDIARTYENLLEQQSINDDASILSVDTQLIGEGGSLDFLPVVLYTTKQDPRYAEDALLDSGAAACCISDELATKLHLLIDTGDRTSITLAVQNQIVFPKGTTKLQFKWKTESGNNQHDKLEAYVVPDLQPHVILPNNYMKKYESTIRKVARPIEALPSQIAVIGFSKLSRSKAIMDAQHREEQAQINREREKTRSEEENAHLKRLLGPSSENAAGVNPNPTGRPEEDQSEATTTKQIALQDAQDLKSLTQDALISRAYLYPFKGILYFLTHRTLWQPLTSKLLPTLTLGLAITVTMFLIAYLPQATVMAFTSGPVAAVSAAILTLSESSTLLNLLSRNFVLGDALIDTFDGTLVARGRADLVQQGRVVRPPRAGDAVERLGKLVKRPFEKFAPSALLRYVMYLPVNFVPVVGTVVFVGLQGKRSGPAAHERYFQLKGWGRREKEGWVERNRGAYTGFGVAAFLLEMVPVVSLVFSFTNAVGAALWAADIERQEANTASTSPQLREAGKKAE